MDTPTLKPHSQYNRSVLMIIVGGACLSLLGIGVRLMESADSLQIIFYRALGQFLVLSAILYFQNRRQPLQPYLEIGSRGLLAATLIAGAGFFLVLAVHHTTVANAIFIVSLAPLSSALLGKLILGEEVTQRTWVAIAIAVVGIIIIFGAGVSSGGLLGMTFAFIMMFCYSGSLVTIRSQTGADMFAICALSGFILGLGVMPFLDTFVVTPRDLMLCLGLGVFQLAAGLVLITKGAEHVPTAQVSLLALLEVVLSPIWVWIGVGEVPSVYSLVGGSIVLIGVILQAANQN